MTDFYQWESDDLLLEVLLQPNAKKTELVGIHGNQLKIRVTAPALENKANKQLIKFLSRQFAVPVSRITLLKGEHNRSKSLRICQPGKLPALFVPAN